MTMWQVNATEAKKKNIPSDKEKAEILSYLKSNPDDNNAVPFLMKKYNCSEFSIMRIIMSDQIGV